MARLGSTGGSVSLNRFHASVCASALWSASRFGS
jgi:hypothetical protein